MAEKLDVDFTEKVTEESEGNLPLCIQCGTCTGSCPSGRITAFRIRQLVRKAQLGLKEEILPTTDLWQCTTCYTCYERCPRGVDIPAVVYALRNMAVKEGHMMEAHKKAAGFLVKTGHLVPITEKYEKARKKLGLTPLPLTTLSSKKALEEFQKIVRITKFDELIK